MVRRQMIRRQMIRRRVIRRQQGGVPGGLQHLQSHDCVGPVDHRARSHRRGAAAGGLGLGQVLRPMPRPASRIPAAPCSSWRRLPALGLPCGSDRVTRTGPALLPHLTPWPAMNRPGCGAGCDAGCGAGCSWRPCGTGTGVAHWLGAERWCGARLADEAAKTAPP